MTTVITFQNRAVRTQFRILHKKTNKKALWYRTCLTHLYFSRLTDVNRRWQINYQHWKNEMAEMRWLSQEPTTTSHVVFLREEMTLINVMNKTSLYTWTKHAIPNQQPISIYLPCLHPAELFFTNCARLEISTEMLQLLYKNLITFLPDPNA